MTEYPEYNPLDDQKLMPIEEEKEMTLREVFESDNKKLFNVT